MGPKFVFVFSGVDLDAVTTFVTDVKNETEIMEISLPINKDIEEVEIEEIERKSKKKKQKEERRTCKSKTKT